MYYLQLSWDGLYNLIQNAKNNDNTIMVNSVEVWLTELHIQ